MELVFEGNEYESEWPPAGLRLHLPEQLMERCQDHFWRISDEGVKRTIEGMLFFPNACTDPASRHKQREFAYAVLFVNKENLMLPFDFCKEVELDSVLGTIKRGGFDFKSKAYRCIEHVHFILND